MDGGVSDGMQELVETSQPGFMGMLICVNKKHNKTAQEDGIMSLQDSKNGTRRQSLDSSCSEWIYSPFLPSRVCSCDHACVAARWVKATWNVNGPSWRGITEKAF